MRKNMRLKIQRSCVEERCACSFLGACDRHPVSLRSTFPYACVAMHTHASLTDRVSSAQSRSMAYRSITKHIQLTCTLQSVQRAALQLNSSNVHNNYILASRLHFISTVTVVAPIARMQKDVRRVASAFCASHR